MGKGKHLRPDQIAVITALCQAEKSNIYISNYTGINLRTVQLWTKKFRESVDGDVQLQKKQTGRPRKVVPATLRLLKREIEKNPFITARKIKENNRVLQDMSLHTIRKALRVDLQYKRRVAKRKPLLTARQKRMRLALARDKIKMHRNTFRKILCTDEATFCVSAGNSPHSYYVRRPQGSDPYNPKFIRRTVKQPDRLMVWGAIGYHAPGNLVILPRNVSMNSERYIELLRGNLNESFRKCKIPRRNGILLQDGATCHTARIVKEYLENNSVNYIKEWPGNSPDLNPIEHIWAEMKRLLADRDTSSLPKLRAELQDIWRNMDRKYIKTLIDSILDRLREVIARRGNTTSY